MMSTLYPILDVTLCGERGLDPLAVLAAFLRGGARIVQLRDKSAATGARLALADACVRLAARAGAQLIVNDRSDIARLSGADGVHLGQDDLSVAEARMVVGDGAIVGLSTHDDDQLARAAATTANYLAVGPIYGTSTKETGYTARGLDLIRAGVRAIAGSDRRDRPLVAIGGITLERAPAVLAAGASSVAVISDLLAGDPESRVRAFLSALGD